MSSTEATGAHATHAHDHAGDATHDGASYSSSKGSILEKGFIWIAWTLAAAFIVFSMSLYFPNFISPDAPGNARPAPVAASVAAPAGATTATPAAAPGAPAAPSAPAAQ